MIDTMLNLLFRCSHRRLTRPVAPITKAGEPHSQSYVVCLDCGKQFEYDLNEMRIGKAIERSHDVGIVPPNIPPAHRRKLQYGIVAAASLALGAMLTGRKKDSAAAPAKRKPDL